MGRTLPSATVLLMQEEAAFSKFRRALRRSDQLALDDLFVAARQHIAAVQFASHALPFEVYLLSMLLEEHKEVMRLRDQMDALSPAFREQAGDDAEPPACTDEAGCEPELQTDERKGRVTSSQGSSPGGDALPAKEVPPQPLQFRDPGFGLDDAPAFKVGGTSG